MKTKYELEYTLNTSPTILFNRLSTPEGLSEWFADDVNLQKGKYKFIWEGTEQEASVVQRKANKFIRFHWEDDDSATLSIGPLLYWRFTDRIHGQMEWQHDVYDRQETIDHGSGYQIKAGIGFVY